MTTKTIGEFLFMEKGESHLLREIQSASTCSYLEFIRNHEFNSKTVICQTSKATQSKPTFRNTHPFGRKMST